MLNRDQGEVAVSPAAPDVKEVDSGRRKFIYLSAATAVACSLASFPFAAAAAGYSSSRTTRVPPTRKRGSTVLNVLNFGARNDGSGDSTTAFQKAIDALPSNGGTVRVPAGTYRIDPDRSVNLRSNMLLDMSLDAKLVSLPSSKENSEVLMAYKCSNVEIAGGRIVGDRSIHKGSSGEWGHGIYIRGSSKVTIRDVHISNCWGDGICVGGALVWQAPTIPCNDVHIANVVSTNNRRQGLSVGCVRTVKVYDSEFSHSNGTAPECGIDVEPDEPHTCHDVLIKNCLVRNNAKYGILAYRRTNNITVQWCTVEKNGSCGIVTNGARSVYVANTTIRENSATGMFVQEGTKNFQFSQNLSYRNYTRNGAVNRTPFSQTGVSKKTERDILRRGSFSDVRITMNHYR